MKKSVFGHSPKKHKKFTPSFNRIPEDTVDNTSSRDIEASKENQKVLNEGYENFIATALNNELAQESSSKSNLTKNQRLSKILRKHSHAKTSWSPQLKTIQEVNNAMPSLQQ